jgi:hypothetical protein
MAVKKSGAKKGAQKKNGGKSASAKHSSLRFEAAKVDSLFDVLDAVAWMNFPTVGQVAQFAGIDPRTAGKLLKNGVAIALLEVVNDAQYSLLQPYPHKGTVDQKRAVVREALVRLPLLKNVRQFLKLKETMDSALRKAAVLHGVENFAPAALTPLLDWANQLGALSTSVDVEELVDQATEAKEERHAKDANKRVVFLSHSSKDKPIIRQLATDLTAAGVSVWLDEQNIRVGDSISDSIAQGLAESDYFLIALSDASVNSEWVKHELNNALFSELSKRNIKVLPVLLSPTKVPALLQDKKYADFTQGYKHGLQQLLAVVRTANTGA